MNVKTCTKCNIIKKVSEFNKDKKCRFGVRGDCNICTKKYMKQHYIKKYQNNNEYKKKLSKYYKKNKEELKEYGKEYYNNNKKYHKDRYQIYKIMRKNK